ncbi:MAG: DUF4124 domain-containing protein [Methylophilaceae bacterium]|nr:DUF4124 domain-containing protein [Methyloradius sp.]
MKVCISLLLLLFSAISNAGITKWVDTNGEVHYSDQPPPITAKKSQDISISSKPADLLPPPPKPVAETKAETPPEVPKGIDINDIGAVPYLKDKSGYKDFLAAKKPRGFVMTRTTRKSFTVTGGKHALKDAMKECQDQGNDDCVPYAEDDTVVWAPKQK